VGPRASYQAPECNATPLHLRRKTLEGLDTLLCNGQGSPVDGIQLSRQVETNRDAQKVSDQRTYPPHCSHYTNHQRSTVYSRRRIHFYAHSRIFTLLSYITVSGYFFISLQQQNHQRICFNFHCQVNLMFMNTPSIHYLARRPSAHHS